MGMYTKFIIKIQLRQDLPLEISTILKNFNEYVHRNDVIAHPFWFEERRRCFFQSQNSKKRIIFKADIKNYESEIEKFLNWLQPYILAENGQKIGTYHYCERDLETIRMNDDHFNFL
jgi:calcineurin-like phosphoesterase family protein